MQKRYTFLIIIPLLVFQSIGLFSQGESRFERLGIQDGLSHSTVFSLIQDSRGYMWFGTQDGGLNKFDGYRFTVYTHDPNDPTSISTNNISKIIEDKNGKIWIGTWGGGLEMFDPISEKFTHYRFNPNKNSISHDNAQTIFEDKNGFIWIGTSGGGLNKFDPQTKTFIHYKFDEQNPNSISHDRIWDIDEDHMGNIWIGTSDGLNKLNPKTEKFVRYKSNNTPGSISHAKVRTIFIDKSGTVWIGTTNGIDRYNQDSNSFTNFLPCPNDAVIQETNEVNVIFEDHLGQLWIGTHAGGLILFDRTQNKFTPFRSKQNDPLSLSYNDIRDIYEDRSGILWISTRGGGINKLDLKPPKFYHYKSNIDDPNTVSSNRIRSICAGKNNIVWIGTDGGGVCKFDRTTHTFKTYLHDPKNKNSILSNRIRVVFEDQHGMLWIGTDGSGICILNPLTENFSNFNSGETFLSDDDILSLLEDRNGIIWIGTDNGLNKYDPKTKKIVTYKSKNEDSTTLSNNRVWTLFLDKNNSLWVGTDEGLNKMIPENDQFIQYKNNPDDPYSISNNDIFCMAEDNNGFLWIGTGQGLNKFDKKTSRFTCYTEKQGLSGNAVYSIQANGVNEFWISTIKGLSRFDLEKTIFKNYYSYDGLQSNEFNTGCGSTAPDGTIYFGGNNGFNLFHPSQVKANEYIPQIVFTDFYVLNELIKPSENGILKNSINFTKEITLAYHQNVFNISFAALSYNVSDNNLYAYQLEGFDKDWVQAGNRRDAQYTNISPGTYTFKVIASNNDGVWNKEGISLKIIIIPPFWQTKWFYGLCIITFVGLVYFLIRMREKKLLHEKKILEDKVASRTEKIKKQNDELEEQKEALAEKNRDITDSIRYAKRIQEAILPPMHVVSTELKDHFVFYKPKDIVSGDFYWVESAAQKSLFAAVDCTGHGVPGAFVSIVGNNGLNRAVNEFNLNTPSKILDKLNELVVETLRQSESEMKDGMDISLCSIDWNKSELEFAGANNSIYIISPREVLIEQETASVKNEQLILHEIKPDKQPIGGIGIVKKPFRNHTVKLQKGEIVYLFTDGFADQFGGEKGKKFKYAQLKELLLQICHLPMAEQHQILHYQLEKWRGHLEQVDDVCIIGVRV